MRADFRAVLKAIVGLTTLAACLAAGLRGMPKTAQSCDVPAYLLSSDSVAQGRAGPQGRSTARYSGSGQQIFDHWYH